MAKVKEIIELMQAIAPEWLACEGDPVGLHAGSRKSTVKRIMLALDATVEVIAEAKKKKCDMLITHHPRFFRGLKTVDEDTFEGEIAASLIRNKIALYCAHTNLDAAPGGINDMLADIAGLVDTKVLDKVCRDRMLKLTVFVPDENIDEVKEAICDAGAGAIGEYTDCTYRVPGLGTFRPSDESDPYIGSAGVLEEVEEWRLEAVLPESAERAVLAALKQVHPYEEIAYDVVNLRRGESYGLGRVGKLKKKIKLQTLAKNLKKSTGSQATTILGDSAMELSKIAVWSGSGVNINKVVRSGVDALVCGELSYHFAEILQKEGIAAIVLGHGPCEQIILEPLAESLHQGLEGVEVVVASCMPPSFKSV